MSAEIKRGETFGLIGESGCGKSVTCRSLMRLLKEPGQITGGEILYKGKNVLEFHKKNYRHFGAEIGMIFQDPMTTLNPVLTMETQLVESMKDEHMTKNRKRNMRRNCSAGRYSFPKRTSEMLCASVLRRYEAACHDCHCAGIKAPSSAGR